MSCVTFLGIRPIFFDIPVLGMVAIFVILDMVVAFLDGLTISTQTLHLMGAVLGLGVGIAMVKLDWVDCENWDVSSIAAGRHEMTPEQLRQADEQSPEYQRQQREQRDSLAESTRRNVEALIEQDRPDTALALYQKVKPRLGDWLLPERDMLALIAAMHRRRLLRESIPVMVEYLRGYTSRTAAVRLNLAQIMLTEEKRPAQARSILAKLDTTRLTVEQESLLARLQAKIEETAEQGQYDFSEHDW